jgi:heterodisulfide reductase subunit B
MQFEQKQSSVLAPNSDDPILPSILISQLIGLSIGMKDEEIGLGDKNRQKLMVSA